MLCAFCKTDSTNIGWDETSHLGKRPICYQCIGAREERAMKTRGYCFLFVKDNVARLDRLTLVNQTQTLTFKVKERLVKPTHTEFVFLVGKKKWIGIMYPNCDRILCRKHKL